MGFKFEILEGLVWQLPILTWEQFSSWSPAIFSHFASQVNKGRDAFFVSRQKIPWKACWGGPWSKQDMLQARCATPDSISLIRLCHYFLLHFDWCNLKCPSTIQWTFKSCWRCFNFSSKGVAFFKSKTQGMRRSCYSHRNFDNKLAVRAWWWQGNSIISLGSSLLLKKLWSNSIQWCQD